MNIRWLLYFSQRMPKKHFRLVWQTCLRCKSTLQNWGALFGRTRDRYDSDDYYLSYWTKISAAGNRRRRLKGLERSYIYANRSGINPNCSRNREAACLYQETEFYAFFHFGMNTYTDREWGDGTEDPKFFNPAELDARDQWVSAAENAGMKGVILTCKHHDGFCLWPTGYTMHSVARKPTGKRGTGDVVKEVSDACRRPRALKFGIYLSPATGTSPAMERERNMTITIWLSLPSCSPDTEKYSVSGWMVPAARGQNGKKQVYDWERYYACVRKYQPDACICVCGPDIRWCGNEAGDVRKSEWSVVPARTALAESAYRKKSQQADDEEFRQRKITSDMEDLGSRAALQGEKDLIWYPAEVNTSIRPGWFYHAKEDNQVKEP